MVKDEDKKLTPLIVAAVATQTASLVAALLMVGKVLRWSKVSSIYLLVLCAILGLAAVSSSIWWGMNAPSDTQVDELEVLAFNLKLLRILLSLLAANVLVLLFVWRRRFNGRPERGGR